MLNPTNETEGSPTEQEKLIASVTEDIQNGLIGGICLDTSIFDKYQLQMEHGWLQRLKQFKGSVKRLYLPTIVQREITAHLLTQATESQQLLKKALKGVRKSWLIDKTNSDIFAMLFGSNTAQAHAEYRVKTFIANTGAELVDLMPTSVAEVFDRYFSSTAPFAEKESKKHEFPDAFALLALEALAEQKGTKLLVVSLDGGWIEFCKTSKYLTCLTDLTSALGCFQDDSARYACKLLVEEIQEGNAAHWLAQIQSLVQDKINEFNFEIDAQSDYHIEEEVYDVSIQRIEIVNINNGLRALEPLDFDNNMLVAQVRLNVDLRIKLELAFYIWDSVDKEEFRLDSRKYDVPMTQALDTLITFDMVDFKDKLHTATSIESIEISRDIIYIELDQVGPDFGHTDEDL